MVKEKIRICRLRDKLLTSTYNGGPDGFCWWTPKPPKQRSNNDHEGETIHEEIGPEIKKGESENHGVTVISRHVCGGPCGL